MSTNNNLAELTLHLQRLISDKFVNLLVGKGYTLTAKNKAINDFWSDWQIEAHFERLVHQIIAQTSIVGEVAVGIEALVEGDEQMFLVNNPKRMGQILHKSWRFNELHSITILKELLGASNIYYYLRETWTKDEVERVFFNLNPKDFSDAIPLPYSTIKAKLPPAYRNLHEGVKPNPYGFIPFELFENYYFNNEPDILRATQEIKNYAVYKSYEMAEWTVGGTILTLSNLDQSTIKDLKATPAFKNLKRILFARAPKGGEGKSLEYVTPNYQIQPFIEMDKYYLTKIFQAVGLQWDTKIENATATEASLNHSTQGSTINLKRQTFNDSMNRLLHKLFMYKFGITDLDEFEFALNENSAISAKELTEQIRNELDLGIVSKKRAIIRLNGCSEDDAQVLLDEINAEREVAIDMINRGMPDQGKQNANAIPNQKSQPSERKDVGIKQA